MVAGSQFSVNIIPETQLILEENIFTSPILDTIPETQLNIAESQENSLSSPFYLRTIPETQVTIPESQDFYPSSSSPLNLSRSNIPETLIIPESQVSSPLPPSLPSSLSSSISSPFLPPPSLSYIDPILPPLNSSFNPPSNSISLPSSPSLSRSASPNLNLPPPPSPILSRQEILSNTHAAPSSSRAPDVDQHLSSPALILDDDDEDHLTQAGEFFRLWAPVFEACQSAIDFNTIMRNCTADWLLKTSTICEEGEIPQMARAGPSRISKARTQSRQQQRVRQRRKFNANEASRIQKLFRLYPRKAVRRVLGETSPRYSGSVEAAASYLRDTYHRPEPPPEHVERARKLYDDCDWALPSPDQHSFLDHPPTKDEIAMRLRRAVNTTPGKDGLEYRHLRKLDPEGLLLERIFVAAWRFGIPDDWRTSQTVPCYKKGDTGDFSNFRPISLLPTIYKVFSGILSQRLTVIASELGWLSPEQKGFLPGVRGIDEHSGLLQTAVEEARAERRPLGIALLDLCNAFGSLPHSVLGGLFASLPIPLDLRRLLLDIYSNNIMEFAVGQESVEIRPSTGVGQGDALSTTIFNLAAEPLLRAAKTNDFQGFNIFGCEVKVTAYADDLAVISTSPQELQGRLELLSNTASALGLQFNPEKCVCILLNNAKAVVAKDLYIGGGRIRCLDGDEQVEYLGVPLGARLRFRVPNQLVGHMTKVADSLLSPCQKHGGTQESPSPVTLSPPCDGKGAQARS